MGIDRRVFLGSGLALASCTAIGRDRASTGWSLADLKRRTFDYFWETTDPRTGLAPDRWPTPSFASIAAVGFALTAYGVGETNGWITRAQARDRTLATLRFFARAPQGPEPRGTAGHKGFFYHFLDMRGGTRFGRTELSTIDTALLMGGVLFAQSWFDRDDPAEAEIRRLADRLYAAVDWRWIRPRAPFVAMGWHPETGFIPSDWNEFNEALILYVLALGSPTHALEPATWDAWTSRFDKSWGDDLGGQGGEPHVQFSPLFGHQYSQCWIDFRGIRDDYGRRRGLDYHENSRRATYAQRSYAAKNPGGWAGYGPDVWGLTACDGPGDMKRVIAGREREFFSYSARGPGDRDDGTIAPTAAAGSIAFAPEIVEPALREMHRRYGAGIYGRYGFWDSFNATLTDPAAPLKHGRVVPGLGWVDGDHLGIDQGPILLMLENRDTGLIWRTMRRNPHIRRGLARAGFRGGWLEAAG
jgi:hypothetical protein